MHPMLAAMRSALCAFSTESLEATEGYDHVRARDAAGFVLTSTGRYAHSLTYIGSVAEQHGWRLTRSSSAVIRCDAGQPGDGGVTTSLGWERVPVMRIRRSAALVPATRTPVGSPSAARSGAAAARAQPAAGPANACACVAAAPPAPGAPALAVANTACTPRPGFPTRRGQMGC
eukprot:363790-Chlamydomonas_euryale.AAC.26